MSEYTIEAAGLSRYNSKGNLFPASKYLSTETTAINTEECFNPTHFNNVVSNITSIGTYRVVYTATDPDTNKEASIERLVKVV